MDDTKLWQRLHAMRVDELTAYAKQHRCDAHGDFAHATDLADNICAQLGLRKPTAPEDDPSAALDAEVEQYRGKHPGMSYSDALSALAKDPGFRSRWTISMGGKG